MKHEVFVNDEKYAGAFFESFLISLVLCLTPFKALAFIIPFICICWFIVRSKSGNSFKRFAFINSTWVVGILFYKWYNYQIGLDFISSNAFLSYLTYSSLFLIFVFPSFIVSQNYNYERYAKLLLYTILIEGSLGIIQRILVVNYRTTTFGDVVEGTINPLSFALGHSGFGNQFFAINMVFFLLFCFPYVYKRKKYRVFFFIGLIALIVASVGHVFYSLLLSIVITYLLFEGINLLLNVKLLVIMVSVVTGLVFMLAKLDPGVFNASQRQLEIFSRGETPKAKAVTVVFTELVKEYPTTHLIGIGPGQYSSRAGLIASGTYDKLSSFFLNIPFLDMGMSEPFKKYMLKTWIYVQTNLDAFGNSTMYRPFSSLLSVYVEFGGLSLILILFFIFYQIHYLKKEYKLLKKHSNKKIYRLLPLSCATAILFLFFLGLYENYYETAQGIFTGVLLILVMKSMVKSSFIIEPTTKVKATSGLVKAVTR